MPDSVSVPAADFRRLPEPLIVPPTVIASERLIASVAPEAIVTAVAGIVPTVPPLPIWRVPALTFVAPVYVLVPVKVSVPSPTFTNAVVLVLDTTPEIVAELPVATPTRAPAAISKAFEIAKLPSCRAPLGLALLLRRIFAEPAAAALPRISGPRCTSIVPAKVFTPLRVKAPVFWPEPPPWKKRTVLAPPPEIVPLNTVLELSGVTSVQLPVKLPIEKLFANVAAVPDTLNALAAVTDTVPLPRPPPTAVIAPALTVRPPENELLALVSDSVPAPSFVSAAEPAKSPETASVRLLATFQLWAAPSVTPLAMERFWVADAMSMPAVPRVSVLPAEMDTAPPGFAIRIPCQERSPPSAAVLAAVTVLFQTPTSAAVGALPPTQLVPRPRPFVLLALMRSAAKPRRGKASEAAKAAQATTVRSQGQTLGRAGTAERLMTRLHAAGAAG